MSPQRHTSDFCKLLTEDIFLFQVSITVAPLRTTVPRFKLMLALSAHSVPCMQQLAIANIKYY